MCIKTYGKWNILLIIIDEDNMAVGDSCFGGEL
jgi:hypothetical protein